MQFQINEFPVDNWCLNEQSGESDAHNAEVFEVCFIHHKNFRTWLQSHALSYLRTLKVMCVQGIFQGSFSRALPAKSLFM